MGRSRREAGAGRAVVFLLGGLVVAAIAVVLILVLDFRVPPGPGSDGAGGAAASPPTAAPAPSTAAASPPAPSASSDLLVTAAHVVEGYSSLRIVLGEQVTSGEVIGFAPEDDVALVRTEVALDGHVFEISDDEAPVAQEVAAVGYPLDGPLSIAGPGIVSAYDVDISLEADDGSIRHIDDVMRMTVPINPGNSGGPVVDRSGAMVGLVSAAAAQTAEEVDGEIELTIVDGFKFAITEQQSTSFVFDVLVLDVVAEAGEIRAGAAFTSLQEQVASPLARRDDKEVVARVSEWLLGPDELGDEPSAGREPERSVTTQSPSPESPATTGRRVSTAAGAMDDGIGEWDTRTTTMTAGEGVRR